MNILRKLNYRNFKLNKKRNIVTVIGITLSVALVACVATMFTSVVGTMRTTVINRYGEYHFATNKVSIFSELQSNPDVKSYFKITHLNPPESQSNQNSNFDGNSAESEAEMIRIKQKRALRRDIYAISPANLQQASIRIIKGDAPNSDSEVLVSDRATKSFNDKNEEQLFQLGDTFKVENLGNREYKVVGFYETHSQVLNYYDGTAFITVPSANQNETINNTTLYYYLKNPKIAKQHQEKYYHNKEARAQAETEGGLIKLNSNLLNLENPSIEDETIRVLGIFAGAVIVIIMVTSIFVIKNSFSISATEKIREFGILKSLGATSKQIRKLILLEGYLLGGFGIVFGVILGIVANYILIFIVNALMSDFIDKTTQLSVHISVLGTIFAVFIGAVTVYFSIVVIAHRARKISAISAIRSNQDIKLSRKKLKTPKIIAKLFGIGGVISHKNLKRNRKKYRTTVISLTISVFAFITVSYIVESMFRAVNLEISNINFNYGLSLNTENYNNTNSRETTKRYEDIATKVSQHFLANSEHSISGTVYANIKPSDINSQILENFYSKETNIESLEKHTLPITFLDDASFNRTLTANLLGQNTRFFAAQYVNISRPDKKISVAPFNSNQITILSSASRNPYSKDYVKQEPQTIQVASIKHLPIGWGNSGAGIYARSSDEALRKYLGEPYSVDIFANVKEPKQVEKSVKEFLQSQNIKKDRFSHFGEAFRAIYNFMLIIQIFGYGFIAVITLIGLTNLFNTIHTNMILRRREFASLRSIGITKKELNKIVALESILYGSKALFLGIVLGLAATVGIHSSTQNKNYTVPYDPPYLAIIFSIIFVLAIVYIIMRYSIRSVNKQNLIETIRNENI